MAQNLIEKIVQKYVTDFSGEVRSGDLINIIPEHVMTHDNTGAVIPKFGSIGAEKVKNPGQPVFALDHNVQDTSDANLEKYRKIEAFAAKHGVDFYPAGTGIGHQIMVEQGYAFPGTFAVASDSHSNMYGGVGALGTPIVRTDAASIWATGRTWWQIPPVTKVVLTGSLQNGAAGKDVILTLCAVYSKDEVLNHALEFSGEGVAGLSMEERLTIANMTTEWGALAAVFPVDETCIDWVRTRIAAVNSRPLPSVPSNSGRTVHPRFNEERLEALLNDIPAADEGAAYAQTLHLDLSEVVPGYSGPHNVKVMHVRTENRVKIDKAYLVSCVNSRVEDLAAAAAVVKGKKVAEHVKFYIAAASREVETISRERGDWQTLLEAGAQALPPGCGPCIGLGTGLLEDGEVGISATNRNFKGRMGSKNAEAYLASPAVVAESALRGFITLPDSSDGKMLPEAVIRIHETAGSSDTVTELLPGFPQKMEGALVWCHADNMNTDGIYPGKYTYNDSMTPEEQAAVAMENYDPEFKTITESGDILVGGSNFGTGSSREQAATALKYRGIQCLISASFSETYKRNAVNNGFLLIEIPALVNLLRKEPGRESLTWRSGEKLKIDLIKSTAEFRGQTFRFSSIGKAAQQIILAGNLENRIREELS